MADFDYIRERVKGMSVTNMIAAARHVHERSDMSTVGVLFDMTRCGFRYSAGYTDYLNCAFETKTPAERKSTITRGVNNGYVRSMNSPELESCFTDKRQLYALFADYIGRDWLDLQKANASELKAFVGSDVKIVVRRPNAAAENGTFVLSLLGVDDYADLRERLLNMGLSLAEKLIVQHEQMERLCGDSVGVIRLVTVGDRIVFACLNSRYDKFSLTAPVDEASGMVTGSAVDGKNGMYHRHPLTDERFFGFRIPKWNEVTALARSASKVLTSVQYCGWDVAVLNDRAELIDATSFPRHDYYRVCDNEKLRRKIEEGKNSLI